MVSITGLAEALSEKLQAAGHNLKVGVLAVPGVMVRNFPAKAVVMKADLVKGEGEQALVLKLSKVQGEASEGAPEPKHWLADV